MCVRPSVFLSPSLSYAHTRVKDGKRKKKNDVRMRNQTTTKTKIRKKENKLTVEKTDRIRQTHFRSSSLLLLLLYSFPDLLAHALNCCLVFFGTNKLVCALFFSPFYSSAKQSFVSSRFPKLILINRDNRR